MQQLIDQQDDVIRQLMSVFVHTVRKFKLLLIFITALTFQILITIID